MINKLICLLKMKTIIKEFRLSAINNISDQIKLFI